MAEIKIDYRLNGAASEAFAPHLDWMANTPGATVMVVAELRRKKFEIDDDDEKDNVVRLRLAGVEIARGETEHKVRDVQAALNLLRTADGTLTEADEVDLAAKTIEQAQGLIGGIELARLKAGLDQFIAACETLAANEALRPGDVRREVGKIVTQARKVSAGAAAVL